VATSKICFSHNIKKKRLDVVIQCLMVKKQLRQQAQVLAINLVFLSINLKIYNDITYLAVVLLSDPFRGMGRGRKNSEEVLQSGHAPRSGPEVKNGGSSAKDGVPERLISGTIQKEVS